MKNYLLYGSMVMLLGGMAASAQEKSANGTIAPNSFAAQSTSYSANDIQVVGTINNGETSKAESVGTAKYQAFVFEGNGHDRVAVTVTGGKAYVALADSTLTPIAGGVGRLDVSLPYHGPDTEAFYILVRSLSSPSARLAVHLQKTSATSTQPSDATR
ncbi:MAG: hypothetical protein ABSG13_14655 [Bryobacteraceae bacterium]|jgi:hypothetical protein